MINKFNSEIMKTILKLSTLAIFFGLVFTSCGFDDDVSTPIQVSKLKIDSISIINDTMDVNSVQSIKTYSTYANSCNHFYGYDYQNLNNLEREITAYQYSTEENCNQSTYVGENMINFNPQQTGTFTLKFWKGDNDWITQNIVVQ